MYFNKLVEQAAVKILIEEYQADWVNDFLKEKDIIGLTLIAFSPAIEHIGSTSVPGLCAKPTIDILVGLQEESRLDQTISPMIDRGYSYFKKYEPTMPYRRLFSKLKSLKGKAAPEIIDVNDEFVRGQEFIAVTNIHAVVKDTLHWRRHLAFRDYLRAHAEVRDEYCRTKKALSKQEFIDTNEYNAAKDRFIKETQSQALAWYDAQEKGR